MELDLAAINGACTSLPPVVLCVQNPVYYDVYRDVIRINDVGDAMRCEIGTFEDVKKHLRTYSKIQPIHEVAIRGRVQNYEFIRHLNEFSNIYKLELCQLDEDVVYDTSSISGPGDLISILESNTPIKELRIGRIYGEVWPQWHNFLSNTKLTRLTVDSLLESSDVAAPLLVSNTSLRALNIYLSDDSNNSLFANSLILNTYLTSLTLHLRLHGTDSVVEQHILNCIRQSNTIKSLALSWANVDGHRGNNISPSSDRVENLWPALAANTSLRDVQFHFTLRKATFNFQNIISQNLTITHFDSGYEMHGDINKMFKELSLRNRQIMWRNVHPVLLDFTLIFHFLPPYIVLEIFDWLSHMQLVKHYEKIQLIISVKRSIQLLKN